MNIEDRFVTFGTQQIYIQVQKFPKDLGRKQPRIQARLKTQRLEWEWRACRCFVYTW